MADPLGQDQQQQDGKDVTLDFLGRPAPVAFKSQPALPAGGGSIGVGAGPATTSAGIGAGAAKKEGAFQDFLSQISSGLGDAGDGPSGGADAAAAGTSAPGPSISGFDPGSFSSFLSLANPGQFGMLGGLLGAAPQAGQQLGSVLSSAGKGLAGSGLLGQSNLTINTPDGGKFSAVPGARVGDTLPGLVSTVLGILGVPTQALTSALAITGTPADAQAITAALSNPEATLSPAQLSMLANAVVSTFSAGSSLGSLSPGQASQFGPQGNPSTTPTPNFNFDVAAGTSAAPGQAPDGTGGLGIGPSGTGQAPSGEAVGEAGPW